MTSCRKSIEGVRVAILGVARGCRVLSAAAIALMMFSIVYDVVMRYALANPTVWAFPLNATAVLAVTFLAIPDLYARDQHISMDLAFNYLGFLGRRGAVFLVRVVTMMFGALLAWLGYGFTNNAYRGGLTTGGLLNLPLWTVAIFIPAAGVLLVLVALATPEHRPSTPVRSPSASEEETESL